MEGYPEKSYQLERFALRAAMFALVAVSIIWTGYFLLDQQDLQRARSESIERIGRTSKTVALHAERTFIGAITIAGLASQIFVSKSNAASSAEFARWMESGVVDTKYYPQIGVINSSGILVAGSTVPFQPIDLSDRPHYLVHLNAAAPEIYIGRTVVGRASKKLSIQVTKRIEEGGKSHGKLVAVVVVSFAPEYFADLYKEFSEQRSLSLVGLDGYSRIHFSEKNMEVDSDVSKTPWFKKISSRAEDSGLVVDEAEDSAGSSVYYSFQRIPGLPLFVVLSTSESDVLAPYLRAKVIRFTGASILSILVLLGALYAVINFRRVLRLNLSLEAQMAATREAMGVKEKFIRNVSHELRTPIAGIASASELIQLSSLDEEVLESAQAIQAASAHLRSLVDNILVASSLESISANDLEVFDVYEILQKANVINSRIATKNNILLNLNVSPGEVPDIVASKAAVFQVVQNLLSNAFKFTDKGTIDINARSDGFMAIVTVKDSGKGISPQDIPRLFKEFSQLEEFGSRPFSGNGLGLYLCDQLVRGLGGDMRVQSEVGLGSEFSFSLPLANSRGNLCSDG